MNEVSLISAWLSAHQMDNGRLFCDADSYFAQTSKIVLIGNVRHIEYQEGQGASLLEAIVNWEEKAIVERVRQI